ncbi:MAG: uroporphyrinogen decarboxylase family protein [Planctomycetota bacterium]|jgi:uroporphyrinogen decarboxylase
MDSREIVKRAIEFRKPPRLPFWQHEVAWAPDDVCDVWDMDRAAAGWFFDNAASDDWQCRWERTEMKNMGQVVGHPLADWSALDRYHPPDPRSPFYYERLGPLLDEAGGRYVAVTCHFNLIERLHMLRGFAAAMEDFVLEPERIDRVLDMILEFKLDMFDELAGRFGDRVDGLFLTDDWGTQTGTFTSPQIFEQFFAPRYATMFDAIHAHGWHVILHSCGRINDFVPRLIEIGVDVLNMQQPQAYGLVEFGEAFRGKVCFLTTADIQTTLPRGVEADVRQEARQLVRHWSTPEGGLVVFNYGDPEALAVRPEMTEVMFDEFVRQMHYWQGEQAPT